LHQFSTLLTNQNDVFQKFQFITPSSDSKFIDRGM
jgi:hypothetical protein